MKRIDNTIQGFNFELGGNSPTITTGIKRATHLNYNFELKEVYATVLDAPLGATLIVDILKNGTSILTTKIIIPISGRTSRATLSQINNNIILETDEVVFTVLQVGTGDNTGAGLEVFLRGYRLEETNASYISVTPIDYSELLDEKTTVASTEAINAVAANGRLTVVTRPDDYVENVQSSLTITVATQPDVNIQSTGTITVTGTPVGDETLTVYDQTFLFKASRAGIGEITIDADNSIQATNIETAINTDITEAIAEAVAGVVTLTALNEAPFIGTGGDVIILTEVATGIAVSGAGTFSGGQDAEVLTIAGINHTFVDTTPGVLEIQVGATTDLTAANIASTVDIATLSLTSSTNTVILEATGLGTTGDGITVVADPVKGNITGDGVTSGGVDVVLSYITLNGIDCIFAETTGDDPTTDYPAMIPVITTTGDALATIADELATVIATDATAFSSDSVFNISNTVMLNYLTKGVIGNTVEYTNNLITAGDITDAGFVTDMLSGGIDGTPGHAGQLAYYQGKLYVCTVTDLTNQNSNWSATTEKPKAYQELISEATLAMDTTLGVNAILSLESNVVLTLENLSNGDEGNIIVIQDAANYTLDIVPVPYVKDAGAGAVTLTNGAGARTILSYTYDGVDLNVTFGSNYTNA